MFREIVRLPEFEKDIKRLSKRFRTLEDDLRVLLNVALVDYHKNGIDNGGIVQIPSLGFDRPKVYKARKFACRSLKGKGVHSGIRVIYAYFEEEDRVELVEMYFKGDKENEDTERIKTIYAKRGLRNLFAFRE
jgi:mRNA-degrading endonuclease RelE of RelBE toxin-antitoxin system